MNLGNINEVDCRNYYILNEEQQRKCDAKKNLLNYSSMTKFQIPNAVWYIAGGVLAYQLYKKLK